MLSCSGSSDNPLNVGVDASDAAKKVDGGTAPLGGSDARTTIPDAAGLDAAGPEATLLVDAEMDAPTIGGESEVGASEAGLGSDGATQVDVPPAAILDAGSNPGADAGGDAGAKDAAAAKDANVTQTPGPDAAQLDASAPDAKVGGSVDAVLPDANVDSSPQQLDAGPRKCGQINCDCTFKGKKLWGNVQYTDIFPDFKVKISDFPDLNVYNTSMPMQCGEWNTVTVSPDFKVQIVDVFEDFDIAYSSFPGVVNSP